VFLALLWFSFSSHRRRGDANCLLPAPCHLSRAWLGLSPEAGHGTGTSWAEQGSGTPPCLNTCSNTTAVLHAVIATDYLRTVILFKVRVWWALGKVWKSMPDQDFSSARTIPSPGLIRLKQELWPRREGQCSSQLYGPLRAQETSALLGLLFWTWAPRPFFAGAPFVYLFATTHGQTIL